MREAGCDLTLKPAFASELCYSRQYELSVQEMKPSGGNSQRVWKNTVVERILQHH